MHSAQEDPNAATRVSGDKHQALDFAPMMARPQAVPESYQRDIAPHKEGSEVAVAILIVGKGAFGFSAESYGYDAFAKPEWRLEKDDYEVTVIARSGQITKKRSFALTYLEDDFSKFKLKATD